MRVREESSKFEKKKGIKCIVRGEEGKGKSNGGRDLFLVD
jgi:hypothetical protein